MRDLEIFACVIYTYKIPFTSHILSLPQTLSQQTDIMAEVRKTDCGNMLNEVQNLTLHKILQLDPCDIPLGIINDLLHDVSLHLLDTVTDVAQFLQENGNATFNLLKLRFARLPADIQETYQSFANCLDDCERNDILHRHVWLMTPDLHIIEKGRRWYGNVYMCLAEATPKPNFDSNDGPGCTSAALSYQSICCADLMELVEVEFCNSDDVALTLISF